MWLWSKWKKTIPSFSLTGNEKKHMRNPCVQNPPCASKSTGFSIAIDNSDLWKQRPSYVITWLSYVQDERREKCVLNQHLSLSVFPRMPSFYSHEAGNFFSVIFDLKFYSLNQNKWPGCNPCLFFKIKFQVEKKRNQNLVSMLCALLPLVVNSESYNKALLYFWIKIHKINQCLRYEGMYPLSLNTVYTSLHPAVTVSPKPPLVLLESSSHSSWWLHPVCSGS